MSLQNDIREEEAHLAEQRAYYEDLRKTVQAVAEARDEVMLQVAEAAVYRALAREDLRARNATSGTQLTIYQPEVDYLPDDYRMDPAFRRALDKAIEKAMGKHLPLFDTLLALVGVIGGVIGGIALSFYELAPGVILVVMGFGLFSFVSMRFKRSILDKIYGPGGR